MKEKLFRAFLACFLLVSAQGCSMREKKTVVRIACDMPADHPVYISLKEALEKAESESSAFMEIELYPEGTLGDQSALLLALEMGTLDYVLADPSALSSYHPVYEVFDLPYLFDNEGVFLELMDLDEMQEYLDQATAGDGFRPAAWVCEGFRQWFSSKNLFEDDSLEGVRTNIRENTVTVDLIHALQGKAIQISEEEVFLAMETGILNGIQSGFTGLVTEDIFSLLSSALIDDHQVISWFLMESFLLPGKLREEDYQLLKKAISSFESEASILASRENESVLEQMKKAGLDIRIADRNRLRQETEYIWNTVLENQPQFRKLTDRIMELNQNVQNRQN